VAEVDRLAALLVVGSALRREVPVLAHRVRKAALAGAQVGFVNPGAMEWRFPVAAEIIAPAAVQAEALAGVLAAACDGDFSGLPGELADVLRALEPDAAQRRMAKALAGEGRRAVWLGLLAQRHPGYADLRLLAAVLCARTGATLGYLSEGANSAGASLAGVLPHRGAGGTPAPTPGLHAGAMLAGGLDAMVLLGCEPEADSTAGAAALEALAETGFVVCLTPWVTAEMKRYASVLLPVGTVYETSGTFVNCEDRRQSFAGAAKPVGEARPAWKVLRVLGNQLELDGFDYMSSEDVRAELETLLAQTERPVPGIPMRAARLRHEGGLTEPGMYATDMLLRRSRPLQETAEGRVGARRWS